MRKIGCAFLCIGLAVAVLSLGSERANAQDWKLMPNFGTKKLESGFLPDPFKVPVICGGNKVVVVNGIKMKITQAPDYRINYKAGGFPLSFYVSSQTDTTLLINTPDTKFYVDDDSGGNLNPLITFKKPLSGQYDIWVGAFGQNKNAPATLFVTELNVTTPIPKNLK